MTPKAAATERQAKGKPDAAREPARDAGQAAGWSAPIGDALPGWTPADPTRHLGPPQVAALQRSAGNRAVAGLLHPGHLSVQLAPAGAPAPTGAKAGSKPRAKGPSFDSYADLINGFQDLTAAYINKGGAGLSSVQFGKDLATAHRSLLWSVRTVFIWAVSGDPGSLHKAWATWPGISGRMLDAVAQAKAMNLAGAALAAVVDQIALVNTKLGAAKGRKDAPEPDSYEDVDDAIRAIDAMLEVNSHLQEAGPGIVREEAPGRPDIVVSDGQKELNAKYRGLIGGVKVGSHVTGKHAQLVDAVRTALTEMRSEKAGSSYAALTKWRQVEFDIRYLLARGSRYQIMNLDIGAVAGRVEQTKAMLNAHYAAVHGGNLEALLTKPRAAGELQARKKVGEALGGDVQRGLNEMTAVEDIENALRVIQHELKPTDRPHVWSIENGPGSTMQIWEAQAESLHAKAQAALRGYMQSLVTALARARDDYDSIKLGNSRTKLRILGAIGGADDPGSFDKETNRMIHLRDQTVKPLIDRGDYVAAFKIFLSEKPEVERRVKAEADYDADLDTGYRRLHTAMSVVQVALVSLVPIAGEAALATAPMWAVGLTATAAGAGGAFVGEGSRQLVTGERDAGKLLSRTWQGGVIGAGAVGPAATRKLGGVLAGGGTGFAEKGGEAIASGLVGEAQNLAGGGKPGEGFVGGSLGSIAGQGAQLLPKAMQTGIPGKLVQAGIGAGVGEVSTGDPLGGAVGAIVPAVVTKAPSAHPGKDETTTVPTNPAGSSEPAAPTGETSIPVPAIGAGSSQAPFPETTTIPGTGITPRSPAPPSGPGPGSETIPGTFPPRPPAPPSGPGPGAETIPGTFPARAPGEPAGPPGTGTAPGIASGPNAPAAPVTAGTVETVGSEMPNQPAETAGPKETSPDGRAGRPAGPPAQEKIVPMDAETGAGSLPAGGSGSTAPQPAGGGQGGSGPTAPQPAGGGGPGGGAIRPPRPSQVPGPEPKPTHRPLVESGKVPATGLTPSTDPVYTSHDLINRGLEARINPPRDAKLDVPQGGAPSTTPTAKYPAEEPTRYVHTDEKPTAGLSADEAYVVTDSQDGKKYLFKPEEAEYPVDRAEARGIRAGEQAPRDVAAPMVAKALEVDAPGTRLATIRNKKGVLQQGVLVEWHERNSLKDLMRENPTGFERLVTSEEFRTAMMSMDALDYLINNLDRGTNFGNYLYEFKDGKLRLTAIDHGLTFTSTKERAKIGDWTRELPEHYPPDLVTNLEKLSKNRAEFVEKIRPFVGDAAVDGFVHRLDIMIKDMHAKQGTQGT